MDVIAIPTNKPIVRDDRADMIYKTMEGKFKAVVDNIKERNEAGQPVLVGTVAVETSEVISQLLKKAGVKHEVLNAKNHEREAEIIEKAGHVGSVTIATNMAGRGTDIKLGEGVVELGGLAVLGSERHESRRIDNQLRGRAGRQGDPGFSRFYISAEDELLVRFGGENFKRRIQMLQNLNEDTSAPIESKMFSRFVASAQKRIEGNNFDSRKNVLKYDDVLRMHREIIYQERTDVLTLDNIEEQAMTILRNTIEDDIYLFVNDGRRVEVDYEGIFKHFDGTIFNKEVLAFDEINNKSPEEIKDYLLNLTQKEVQAKKDAIPEEVFNEFLKVIMLRIIDTYWMSHIDTMSELRQGVMLQAYDQQNPLVIYQKE